ncbi:hypothetical protein C2S51_008948 [Perilla frutescens var. frutescens]|nr:hypothetical protein C2S51_008948 [Perilla frutescens var. frutescens]
MGCFVEAPQQVIHFMLPDLKKPVESADGEQLLGGDAVKVAPDLVGSTEHGGVVVANVLVHEDVRRAGRSFGGAVVLRGGGGRPRVGPPLGSAASGRCASRELRVCRWLT